jgi:light-regulated signal transduction histidine kinase (bacteriophytochrome)
MKNKKRYLSILLLAITFIFTTIIIILKTNTIRDRVEYNVGTIGSATTIASTASSIRDSLVLIQEIALNTELKELNRRNLKLKSYPELQGISRQLIALDKYIINKPIDRVKLETDLIKIKNDCDKVILDCRKALRAYSENLSDYWNYTHIIIIVACLLMILLCYFAFSFFTTEDSLKKSNEQLQYINKELESFSYSVAHDMRAPIRAMSGYAGILKEDYEEQLNEEGKRLVENIQLNAIRMGTLIDDLLAFSRLGRKEIVKTKIDMNKLTASVIDEVNQSYPNDSKITFSNLHYVTGDYSLLKQAMFNLVFNAVKYSSKKDHPEITVSSESKNSEILFSVSDNGVGFDMKYASKLFEVFQRLHADNEFSGTGIGLAIVHKIITKHNGRLFAEGKVNEGATFYFTLPVVQ